MKLPDLFSVKWMLAHIRTSSYGEPYTFVSETRFRRLVKVPDAVRLVEYVFEPRRRAERLRAVLLDGAGPKLSKRDKPQEKQDEISAISRFVFGLEDDLEACYTVLNRAPQIKHLVRRYHGLRMVRTPDLYESLLITILGQQVSVASAQAQRRRLMAAFGEKIAYEGQEYLGMPEPGRLVDAGEKRLKEIGLTRQKARYLYEMARQIAEEGLSRHRLQGVTCEQAVDRLMEIPGVGRWTAEIVAMRGLGFQDVFPAGDLGLRVAAERVFDLPRRPSEKELRDLVSQWEGWRSYAAFYLWMTLMEGGYA